MNSILKTLEDSRFFTTCASQRHISSREGIQLSMPGSYGHDPHMQKSTSKVRQFKTCEN